LGYGGGSNDGMGEGMVARVCLGFLVHSKE